MSASQRLAPDSCLRLDAPANALTIDASLHEKNVWHVISRNPPVRGCIEAAYQRRRLGQVGIPIWDELKSLVCAYDVSSGASRYVVLHGRGHQKFDFEKASAYVGHELRGVPSSELRREFDLEYGTVNPVAFRPHTDVLQVIDDTVLATYYPPHSVMTNCGDISYGLEFVAADLFSALPNTCTADIVVDFAKRLPQVRTLGILTGNAPESGMLLWERINARVRHDRRVDFRGDFDLPTVIVHSVPELGASMELARRKTNVEQAVMEGVGRLCEGGADVIGIASNTLQHFADDVAAVCAQHGAEFVAMAPATATHLRRRGINRFDFLSIDAVIDLRSFGNAFSGFEIALPTDRQLRAITQLAYEVKLEVVSPSAINRLRDLMNHAVTTDTVVVALTELSILLSRHRGKARSGRRFIDTLDVLAERMADIYITDRIAVAGA